MATIVLSAVGAAAGASIGGGVLGLSSVVIGRAIGASVGRAIDQRLMGSGSEVVETQRVDRFRLNGAGEGAPVGQVYGRMRVAGQVIWASQFKERVSTSGGGGGGKGSPPQPKIKEYSYSVNLAIALCEGQITRVGRVWADGQEIPRDSLNLRVYLGTEDQLPDPKIEAVEGAGTVPAFRGTAYVVLEDLDLGQFGNRVPQLNFEVMRPAQEVSGEISADPANGVQGVALIPGSGEYALATTPVYMDHGVGKVTATNINSPSGKTDFSTSIESLNEELPNCGSASLVVSWFGDDLRIDQATLRPKVEQSAVDGKGMAWNVSGLTRSTAQIVPKQDGRSIYGGTSTDQSVIQAINRLEATGKSVVFYPFILMDQLAGNGQTDPWSGASDQPVLPWRGRMTLSVAPGQSGSPDQTAAAEAEVAAFFGSAAVNDFSVVGNTVDYTGPNEWSYRRFILHYAHLCAAAGGVDAFCIGSEMRGLTQIRGASGNFPAVEALVSLAADVRTILGVGTKIGYAADWSEYFGYHPQDGSGDVYFHLDPLWADPNVDFIGIDNYMPLADWRDGTEHADAHWGAIYNTAYLKSNIEGGEGYDWYYPDAQAAEFQLRAPIQDGAYGEDWVYRYKDIRNWWQNLHHNRVGGSRSGTPTDWLPESKPVWFMEIGCAAIDKGANQPNKFLDLKSSESGLPNYSDGRRDDLMQMQYLRAMFEYWGDGATNPVSSVYAGPMIDTSRMHVWAWDVRPFPFFPHLTDTWSDAENYFRGHWLNGRTSARGVADVVKEICARSGVHEVDIDELYGYLRGYAVTDADTGRAALQPLMLAYGFEAIERDGKLIFRNRNGLPVRDVDGDDLALIAEQDTAVAKMRSPEAESVGRLILGFIDADGDYDLQSEQAIFPDDTSGQVAASDIALLMTRNEARATTERWLSESRVAKDAVQFSLPLSGIETGAGDVVALDDGAETALYRIDRTTQSNAQLFEAVRVEPEIYHASDAADLVAQPRPFSPPIPVHSLFLDLPLLRGDEVEHSPHIAVTSTPWPGSVAVYSSASDSGYGLNKILPAQSIIGETLTTLAPAQAGILDRGAPLRVILGNGALSSGDMDAILNGENIALIGDGSAANWEIFQFTDALLVGPDTYDLSGRLRGQGGSDHLALSTWPAGSKFVLLSGVEEQLDLTLSARGLARHYRIGPANRPLDDPSFTHYVEAFDGIGLRPLSPVHLHAVNEVFGDLTVSWVRRTRIDGDNWQSVDVPLGEDTETYIVRVIDNGSVIREVTTVTPFWTYSAAAKATDGLVAPYSIEVAQVSARFGPGIFRRIDIDE